MEIEPSFFIYHFSSPVKFYQTSSQLPILFRITKREIGEITNPGEIISIILEKRIKYDSSISKAKLLHLQKKKNTTSKLAYKVRRGRIQIFSPFQDILDATIPNKIKNNVRTFDRLIRKVWKISWNRQMDLHRCIQNNILLKKGDPRCWTKAREHPPPLG